MTTSVEGGSPFMSAMMFAQATVRITGRLTRYTRTGESGKFIHPNFCNVCGSTLLPEFDVNLGQVSIKVCSLDDPSWLKPDRHLFVYRMLPVAVTKRRTDPL